MWWFRLASRSLRTALALRLGLAVALCMGLLFALIDHLVDAELYQRFDAGLAQRLQALAGFVGAPRPQADINAVMPQFRPEEHTDFYQAWDGQGAVIARSPSSHGRDLARPAQVEQTAAYYDLPLPDGHRGRALARALPLPADDPRRALILVVAEEREQLDALERRLHGILVLSIGSTLAVVLLLAGWSVRRGLAPLHAFGQAVAALPVEAGPASLNHDRLPDELQPVADKLTAALGRLYAALERERRFARDLAHELRTPLAEARTLLDLARRRAPNAADLGQIDAALDRMQGIVSTLLWLARIEAGIEQPQPDPLDLAALLHERCRRLAERAQAAGQRLHVTAPTCWVMADSALLERVLDNLLGNAVQHAPLGDCVDVGCQLQPPRLWVENAAPQLAPADLPRLGERFFHRGNGQGDGTLHAGLGLSLAHALCQAQGLTLHFTLNGNRLRAAIDGFAPLPAVVQENDTYVARWL